MPATQASQINANVKIRPTYTLGIIGELELAALEVAIKDGAQ